MGELGAPTPSAGPAAPPAAPVDPKLWQAAKQFEAMAIGQLLAPMFDTVDTAHSLFGGGEAEATWKPMLVDAIGKQIEAHGGFGLAQPVYAAMLRAQEAGGQDGGARGAGSPAPGSQASGSQASGSQASGSQASGSQASGSQAAVSQAAVSQAAGAQVGGAGLASALVGASGRSALRPVNDQPRKTR